MLTIAKTMIIIVLILEMSYLAYVVFDDILKDKCLKNFKGKSWNDTMADNGSIEERIGYFKSKIEDPAFAFVIREARNKSEETYNKMLAMAVAPQTKIMSWANGSMIKAQFYKEDFTLDFRGNFFGFRELFPNVDLIEKAKMKNIFTILMARCTQKQEHKKSKKNT